MQVCGGAAGAEMARQRRQRLVRRCQRRLFHAARLAPRVVRQ